VIVRDLGRRWGSCTHKSGRIRIHWATMRMPPGIVDYILVHELVRLVESNHSSAF
jgi:predicted metal-dependent hydrolase